jgi:hypothetical protein
MTTPAPVFQAARRPRTPLTIDLDEGVIQAGGHRARFDPAADDAVELAYLKLVRRMRDVHREPSFVLRSDDVEALAAVLRRDAVTVLDRLGELMGATVTQRRSMVTSFLAGALLIAVATSAVALGSDDGAAPDPVEPVAGESPSPEADGRSTAAGEPDDPVAGNAPVGDGPADGGPAGDGPAEGAPADGEAPSAEAAPGPAAAVRAPATSPPAAVPSPPRAGTSPSSQEQDRSAVPRDPRPAPDPPSSDGGADGVAPPAPPAPARPAPPVEGEPDAWTWDDPEVDQPGAIIDIPSDPEVVQPRATIDPPASDPEAGAA